MKQRAVTVWDSLVQAGMKAGSRARLNKGLDKSMAHRPISAR